MDIIQSIILGTVQGITEFLPVSSSGHLALLQDIFGFRESSIFFDTLVHLGTLSAVIVFLRKDIFNILKTLKEKATLKLIALIIVATVPAIIVGLLLQDIIEVIFASMIFIGLSFILTSIILSATYFLRNYKKDLNSITWFDTLFIGVFQALAILPGVSRSGSTISASFFRGVKKEDAFKFSFLMSIPVILGAFLLQLSNQNFRLFNGDIVVNLVGFLSAVIFGLLSLKIIERVVIKGKLHYFAVYTFILGALILIVM